MGYDAGQGRALHDLRRREVRRVLPFAAGTARHPVDAVEPPDWESLVHLGIG